MTTSHPLLSLLQTQGFIVLDGALATELEYRGLDLRDPLWSARALLEAPEQVRAVHLDYLLAGADVITTASYQASFEGLAARGHHPPTVLARSVELALAAREQFWQVAENRVGRIRPLVAASVGPYGAFLADGSEYRGNYGLSIEALMDWHRPRLEVLLAGGADLLACETIPCLDEAVALTRLLAERPSARAWLSFSCCDDRHLCGGAPLAEAAALAETCEQVLAVGVNCTPPRFVQALLREAASRTTKPLLAYPNSGEQWDAAGHCWLPAGEAEALVRYVPNWYGAGARLLGGCCRTRPEDVRSIRQSLASVVLS